MSALSRELLKLDNDVVVIKPGIGLNNYNEYCYENIRVVEYPETALVDKALQTGKRKPDGLNAFKNLLLSEKPDVIHFHEITGSNGITIDHLRTAEELGIPVFMTLHLIGYSCQTGSLRYKDQTTCNGVVDAYKCAVCTLHKKGFRYGSAEMLASVGRWINANNVSTSSLPMAVSGALSYPSYTLRHFSILADLFTISEKVFVLSSWFKEVLLANNLPAKKMVLLDKAVPTWTVGQKTESKHEKHEQETLRFVYLGRISEIKGLHVVLEALKDIDQARWSLDIYGQVEEKDYYLKCNRIIEDSRGIIDWKGIIDPKDVVDILQQYDALIFPTVIQEMVGLVVQEAFAAGIPVIGSKVMGIAEQITDDVDGLLFKAGNSEELNKLLKKVIASPSILSRLASNIKAPASFTNVAGQTLHHYQSVVDAKKLRPVN